VVFDWLDRNHDGFLTRADLEQGLISSCKLLCDSLSYWLWLYTPKELLKHEPTFEEAEEREYGQQEEVAAEEVAYMLVETLQKLIPAESFLRFLETVFFTSSETGTISREEWIFPGSFPLLNGNFEK
jgi:hypothetical protein